MYKIPTIKEMLGAGMHFGHITSKWHPKMEPFIFCKKNNIHIIDLQKSQKLLTGAMEFIEKFAQDKKTILFVATKVQAKKEIEETAKKVEMPYVTEKWLGGTITNFFIIKKLINKYNNLLKNKKSGKLNKYTKKEKLEFDREIEKLEKKVGGLKDMTKLPDAIFVWDVKKEKTAIIEAQKKNIPVIAICDTNSNPKGINYIIPSNDDATKTIKLITDLIAKVILSGKAKVENK